MVDMRKLPGGRSPLAGQLRLGGVMAAAFALLLLAGSTYYTVEPEEVAVITRFGRFQSVEEPGLHFKLPFGIEAAEKVKVDRVEKEEFGFRTSREGSATRYSDANYQAESTMITGDLNLAEVEWSVQYKIKQPEAFLFHVKDPDTTLRAISESAMRAVVGDRSVTEVLTERAEIESLVEELMQGILDSYDGGVKIERVEVQNVLPPDEVRSSYQAVEAANQERKETILKAQQAYNAVIPQAQGEALQVVSQADGYKLSRVNRALGEAQRFTALLQEYKKAPEVTRRRMYLEAMAEVLPRVRSTVIVDEALSGLLPFLDLGGDK